MKTLISILLFTVSLMAEDYVIRSNGIIKVEKPERPPAGTVVVSDRVFTFTSRDGQQIETVERRDLFRADVTIRKLSDVQYEAVIRNDGPQSITHVLIATEPRGIATWWSGSLLGAFHIPAGNTKVVPISCTEKPTLLRVILNGRPIDEENARQEDILRRCVNFEFRWLIVTTLNDLEWKIAAELKQ
jgi:hypothetical protein